jgi:hypothetical protein
MRDGFVRAHGIAAHAVDIQRAIAGATDRDAEADMRSTDVGHQPQHRRAVEVLAII